ncbi:hypothetical protein DPMN_085297 [Dreissena polymorpha]|uniref:Uncharacterized protein n=1 Tax=Dreissena polymorpha TaxID=45954 RepID=A0A9D3YG64_DREPO|nr:hypothetical protein DPMN_085297 [Dreissena polymorpha]
MPHTDREPFVRFVADILRTAPQQQYNERKELIFDIVCQAGAASLGTVNSHPPYGPEQFMPCQLE